MHVENKSTSLAISDLGLQQINNNENKLFFCSIFLGFSDAFDTVNHSIYLGKPEHFRGIVYAWFKSYSTDTTQGVTINGINDSELLSTVVSHKVVYLGNYCS